MPKKEAPEQVIVTIDELSLGEVEHFERISEATIHDAYKLIKARKPFTTKMLIALVFLTKRREDPSFTEEQAREVRITELVPKSDPPTGGKS